MRDEILTYWDMCTREKGALQRGMYFREPAAASIVLMSRRPGAPYVDSLSADGTELEYEGHDVRKGGTEDPKGADQPWELPNGSPTENALFARAAEKYREERGPPPKIRVYEKLRPGIWSDRGLFDLVNYLYVKADGRMVFRFKMRLSSEPHGAGTTVPAEEPIHSRIIPSWVKQAVYKRDKGRCVICEADDQLHFDHDLPFSRGGTSIVPDNVRLLCARHNLQKSARIE